MKLNVAAVRACYPALADGYAYLDGAAGTQVPTAVIDAISRAQAAGLGNSGGAFPASHRADAITAACRAAIAALTGGHPDGVVLGPNMTTLTYRFAVRWRRSGGLVTRSSCRGWTTTRTCGHGSRRRSRRAPPCAGRKSIRPPGSCPPASTTTSSRERTRLVAVTAASNIIGTRPDVPAITAAGQGSRGAQLRGWRARDAACSD